MALGAQSVNVLRLIIRQGMVLVLIGLSIGVFGAIALTPVISTLLFGVGARDPVTFVVVAALLSMVSFVACYIPARRATRIDPLLALRCE
jgi:putative ABC transport system permease protein